MQVAWIAAVYNAFQKQQSSRQKTIRHEHEALTAESRHTRRRSATSVASPYELITAAAGENAASPARATVVSYGGTPRIETRGKNSDGGAHDAVSASAIEIKHILAPTFFQEGIGPLRAAVPLWRQNTWNCWSHI